MTKEIKLLENIKKSGYPFELKVGNILVRKGFRISQNCYYLDKDEHKGREIDAIAYTNEYVKDKNICVGLHLICEIKTSNRPWVVFTSKRDSIFELISLSSLWYGAGKKALKKKDIDKNSFISKFERIGRSYCEGFKDKDEKSKIFTSLLASVKGAEHCLQQNMEANKSLNKDVPKEKQKYEMYLVEPVIVLKGELYESYLDKKDALIMNRVNSIPVSFRYLSPQYDRRGYLVSIVVEEELENYLDQKNLWVKEMKDSLIVAKK